MEITNIIESTASFVKSNKEKIYIIGAGILGVATIGATVRATLKCEEIIKNHKKDKDLIGYAAEIDEEYAVSDDHKNDILKANVNCALSIAKEVALPTVLAAGTVGFVVANQAGYSGKINKLGEAVTGLSAAYTAIDTAFKKYRKNVIFELGEEADKRFRYGIKKETVEEEVTDENGKTKKVKKDISVIDEIDPSDYAKFFDGECKGAFIWKDPYETRPDWDANIHFLNCQAAYANSILQSRGYLFLNEVYDMLSIKPTKAGQVVGWIYDPENPDIDSHVSFGTYDLRNRRIINGDDGVEYEECMLLDFNVDGPIIDKINLGDI